jgi:glycosyltransferase involved in cell wall biosynthesis
LSKPNGCPAVSIIICALNEEESVVRVLSKIPNWIDEILLVDGHSTDNTIETARMTLPKIKVLSQPGIGKGDALRCGITSATGEIIVTLDADDATDPNEINKFINALLRGYDFAKGSRLIKGKTYNKPWYRIAGNCIITITFDILFLRPYTDICSGYNAFW